MRRLSRQPPLSARAGYPGDRADRYFPRRASARAGGSQVGDACQSCWMRCSGQICESFGFTLPRARESSSADSHPPPLPCREPTIGRPQARKAPSSRAIFQMPSEPRRLGDTSKAVSERLLSLITRTPPPAVRVQNRLRLQRFGPIDGPEVRGRYSTQCAVRETEVESLCGLLGKGPLPGAEPTGRNDPMRALRWSTCGHHAGCYRLDRARSG